MANAEVLIIGCGIAGATAALRLARNSDRQITIITRASDAHESNTRYAQGGIIGRGPDDTSDLLFEDIVAAGAGVTSPKAARILADEGPQLLNEVLERTAHVVFDHTEKTVHRYLASATILATGGLGRIYRNTTNPVGSRGDGLAMAHRAGARIANAEYVQFHPTALAAPGAEGLLISEAVRGEGGVLLTPDLHPFMNRYAPEWKDLAPRDIVARAIQHEMEANGYSYVLLDIASHMPAEKIRERFPFIYEQCLKVGLDISREPVPVVPAAHYFCGGVLVDEWARSTIRNLYAVGEISCTGVHGANRLASTSLLEGLVWGTRAALEVERALSEGNGHMPKFDNIPPWDESGLSAEPDPALIQGDMQTIQNIMWHYVGLVRSGERLSRAIRELRHLWNEIETFYRTTKLSDGLIGLRNAVEVALIVAQAAQHNRQSRGCHYRQDSVAVTGDRLI